MVNNNFYWTDERNRNASIAVIVNDISNFYLDHGVTALIILTDRGSAINDTLVMNIIVTACDKME